MTSLGRDKPKIGTCEEKERLLCDFLAAIQDITALHEAQTRAVIEGDADFTRFDLLLHLAQNKKDLAKYSWIVHVEAHGCGEL